MHKKSGAPTVYWCIRSEEALKLHVSKTRSECNYTTEETIRRQRMW